MTEAERQLATCEPDCRCGCGLPTCACREFRIPAEWLQPAPTARWEPEPGHAWRSLWRLVRRGH